MELLSMERPGPTSTTTATRISSYSTGPGTTGSFITTGTAPSVRSTAPHLTPIPHNHQERRGETTINDGYLDLFVANGSFDSLEHHNYLHHNNGNGTFTKVTTGNIVTDSSSAVTAAWEDFDNDGCLDLFVSYN